MKLKLLTYYIDYQHDDKIIILFQQTLHRGIVPIADEEPVVQSIPEDLKESFKKGKMSTSGNICPLLSTFSRLFLAIISNQLLNFM